MQAVIGIIPSINMDEKSYFVHPDNVEAIKGCGGLPIILPFTKDSQQMEQMAKMIDGLYLTGGVDFDPAWYDEEPHPKLGKVIPVRDHYEIAMIRQLFQLEKPILGVCRGSQALNIALGGSMYQDIYAQIDGELLQHQQKSRPDHPSHEVKVSTGSLLHQLVQQSTIKVNSRHHQANRRIADSLHVSGRANDGVIEAIEGKTDLFILGLQWHPESLFAGNDEYSRRIYEGFINACLEEKKQ